MITDLKVLTLVNWREEGKWLFFTWLKGKVRSVEVIQPIHFKADGFKKLTYVSKYLSEFYLPLLAVFRRKRYDMVICWQMRIGVVYGILKRIFHAGKPPFHIIQDFHIDLTQTSWHYKAQIGLMKMAIPGIDYFCCTSTEEEEIYSRMFHIPRDRIVFLPLVEGLHHFSIEPERANEDYIFSFGKSDRDYDTLVQAAASLNIRTYIVSAQYKPQVPLPANVTIFREYLPGNEITQWISASRIVVLPLQDYYISAGQLSMLEAMALARPVIVTKNMATNEYAIEGESALFYSAGNAPELAEKIKYLWEHREKAERIGHEARQAVWKQSDKRDVIFSRLLERCAMDIQKGEHP